MNDLFVLFMQNVGELFDMQKNKVHQTALTEKQKYVELLHSVCAARRAEFPSLK